MPKRTNSREKRQEKSRLRAIEHQRKKEESRQVVLTENEPSVQRLVTYQNDQSEPRASANLPNSTPINEETIWHDEERVVKYWPTAEAAAEFVQTRKQLSPTETTNSNVETLPTPHPIEDIEIELHSTQQRILILVITQFFDSRG